MLVDVTSTMASVGCSIFGSGTDSTLTSRLPCHVTAFMERAHTRLPPDETTAPAPVVVSARGA
ncbi:alcohol dehydrogenase GroES domain protein [Mycobacterium intracellulare]|nr:alcohol dehydrogenase GroES domain protein [Mycobacterium intracellulare]